MIKVYTGKLLDFKYLPVLFPNLGSQTKASHLFINNAFKYLTEPVFELTDSAAEADYLLIPHEYFLVARNAAGYLEQFLRLARTHQKKILAFTHTDIDEEIPYSDIIIFRISQYRFKMRNNEVLMPPYAEDLLGSAPLPLRHKENRKPVVGFCGWAKLTQPREQAAYYVKLAQLAVKNFLTRNQHGAVHKSGIWFRKKALQALKKSSLIETNFLIRDSFSGHQSTIKLDPEAARKEYIDNMINSDFALAVKGGGNNSLRFYEALSLGRVPVLLDTDCVLPLEDVINYKEFTLIVDYKDIDKIAAKISDFYSQLDEESYKNMQLKGRQAFAQYLRMDSFFRQIPDILKKIHDQR